MHTTPRRSLILGALSLVALAGAGAPQKDVDDVSRKIVVGLPDPSLGRGMLTIDENGGIDGFARHLVELAAGSAGLDLEFRHITHSNGERELLAGEIDVICPLSVNMDRVARFAFTTPILLVNGGVFVRPGTIPPTNVAQLAECRIAVAEAGIAHQFCVENGLAFDVEPSLYDALQRVVDGKADCVVSTRIAGRVEMESRGMEPLADASFDQERLRTTFALALRPGDKNLEARLNYGLARVRDSGQWDELYDRWVARYQPRPRPASFVPILIGILVLLVGAGLVGMFVLRSKLTSSTRALGASETRYRVVAESLPALVYSVLVRQDGRRELLFTTSNRETWRARFPGLDPAAEVPLRGSDVHPEDRERYANGRQHALATRTRLDLEFRVRSASGTFHWLHVTATPVALDEGVVWQCLLQDTTQLREAQDERHRLELKLAQAQKLEGLGLMAGSIAHDFNNLLMEIQGNVELALESTDGGERADRLDAALVGTWRAAERTKHLLASAGELRLIEADVDLGAIVRETVGIFRASHGKHVHLELEVPEEGPYVRGDAGLLRRVLQQLLRNAAEAIPQERDGHVTVRVGERTGTGSGEGTPERRAELIVSDDGCGMDETVLERAFDPFFSTKFVGRGLGLTVVQRTVERHGGTVHVRSGPAAGATFTVLLPLASRTVAAPLPAPSCSDPRRVLVVDDEDAVLEVTCSLLESRGWSTGRAHDAAQALAALRETRPAAVLVDVSLPDVSGLELLQRIRGEFPGLAVVLMSGFSDAGAIEQAGADGFLSKPFSSGRLVALLEQVTVQGAAPVAQRIGASCG